MATYMINNTTLTFDKIIYLNAANGSDSNDGLTPATPKKTISGAYAILHSNDNAIVMTDGIYDFDYRICVNTCHLVAFIGTGINTRMRITSDGIYPNNSSANPGTANLSFYRLIWDGNNFGTAYNNISVVTIWNFYNVVFINMQGNSYSYFIPATSAAKNIEKIAAVYMYNCVKPVSTTSFLRTDCGTIRLTNCYGAFTSGYATTQASWDYATNIITSNLVLTPDYRTFGGKDIGTGTDVDGSQADIGLYGGPYATVAPPKPVVYGEAVTYYVSQQHGNDSNDGLTSSTAWATLGKAAQTVLPKVGSDVYVYVAPGVYRESVVLQNTGAGPTERIIFKADPDCVYSNNDAPGIVRITSAMPTECIPSTTNTRPITFANCRYIEFHGFYIDTASSDTYVVYGDVYEDQKLVGCKFFSPIGPYFVTCYNCRSLAAFTCYYGCQTYNSIAVGSLYGFYGGGHINSISIGSTNGFSLSDCYNCAAIGSDASPFINNNRLVNCYAAHCNGNYSGNSGIVNYKQISSYADTTNTYLTTTKVEITPLIYGALLNKGAPNTTIPNTDFYNLTRTTDQSIDIGPFELSSSQLDWVNYYTKSPSYRFNSAGETAFQIPVEAGKQITIKGYVKSQYTAADKMPQIVLRLPDGTEYTSTASLDNTWENLSMTQIPSKSGIATIILRARDYCEVASLDPFRKGTSVVLSNNNLTASVSPNAWYSVKTKTSKITGKWYFEVHYDSGPYMLLGIGNEAANVNNYVGADNNSKGYYSTGTKYSGGTYTSYGAAYAAGDTIGIALDLNGGTLTFYKNGVSQGIAFNDVASLGTPVYGMLSLYGGTTATARFTSDSFVYPIPDGYQPWNTLRPEPITYFSDLSVNAV